MSEGWKELQSKFRAVYSAVDVEQKIIKEKCKDEKSLAEGQVMMLETNCSILEREISEQQASIDSFEEESEEHSKPNQRPADASISVRSVEEVALELGQAREEVARLEVLARNVTAQIAAAKEALGKGGDEALLAETQVMVLEPSLAMLEEERGIHKEAEERLASELADVKVGPKSDDSDKGPDRQKDAQTELRRLQDLLKAAEHQLEAAKQELHFPARLGWRPWVGAGIW
ncbi:hypothetical protein CYMTET_13042 [Cymbomonas tetramitiformis]|uniref:Uncharacterized protein n=1 Tax=Cymbomonas tetramitiformis TaxID=36881 RepID=A0AAE0GJ88_9CHLO|nr:hypothetical protein CYMTET_13042 [Cymbomonas tetramitiformis]